MITLRIPAHLFGVLRSGFEAWASDEAPIDVELLRMLPANLIEANATAMPGLPVLLTLDSAYELHALMACFEVGSESTPNVTDDQWPSVQTLFRSDAYVPF